MHENISRFVPAEVGIRSNYFIHKIKKMKGFKTNIEKDSIGNEAFRKVLYTAKYFQLVLMSLRPNEDIGEEIHPDNDQFFRFEAGHGKCIIDGTEYKVKNGDVVIIPAGAKHNIINLGKATELKMYTIYAPPHHKDGILRATKKEAETNTEEFEGVTTE
jgi:mannose-6-phosphate isomerase-like protein (cupin superfamily)